MIVYRICKTYPPDHNPIDGEGAARYGGRWNSTGTPMVYTAESLALARSEMARHINLEAIPDDYHVYEIEIPDTEIPLINPLPIGWDADPETKSTQMAGDKAFEDYTTLAVKVPSVCDTHSYNYLLNPRCTDYNKVRVIKSYPFKS